MSYIITDDKHYKNIANSLRSKMQTDREYYPEDMAVAVDNIPSSADGTDNPITGIYFLNPDENGYPTKIKVSGWSLENKESKFPIVFNDKIFSKVESVEFLNCDFKYLLNSCFSNMQCLKLIVFPESITNISESAFYKCDGLTSVTIPESVTNISAAAFNECSNLQSVTIPEGVTSIGNDVFRLCYKLKSITIPASLTNIYSRSFASTPYLEFVELGQDFNADNLDLSSSTKYSRETVVNMFKALYDRTGLSAYTLILNKAVGDKLTDEDKAIATNKNWTIVYK